MGGIFGGDSRPRSRHLASSKPQPGLADYVVMVRNRSKAFLAGPPLLKAATEAYAVARTEFESDWQV